MFACPCLISHEGAYYEILEIVQGTVSLRKLGKGTIIAYKLTDAFMKFEMICTLSNQNSST